MAELARRDQNGIYQLLDLRITSLGLIKYLAYEVYWTLHLVGMPSFLVFDDNSYADDARSRGDLD